LAIGALFFGLGIWLLWLWIKMRGGRPGPQLLGFSVKEPALIRFLGVALGLGLAVTTYCWPQHWWATMVANDTLLPGKLLNACAGMAWYNFVKLWPLLLMAWVYRSIRRNGVCAVWTAKRTAMNFAVSAAFILGLGLGLVLLFYRKI
jgi:hypothetical protein